MRKCTTRYRAHVDSSNCMDSSFTYTHCSLQIGFQFSKLSLPPSLSSSTLHFFPFLPLPLFSFLPSSLHLSFLSSLAPLLFPFFPSSLAPPLFPFLPSFLPPPLSSPLLYLFPFLPSSISFLFLYFLIFLSSHPPSLDLYFLSSIHPSLPGGRDGDVEDGAF